MSVAGATLGLSETITCIVLLAWSLSMIQNITISNFCYICEENVRSPLVSVF
jgi:hypothetical protein